MPPTAPGQREKAQACARELHRTAARSFGERRVTVAEPVCETCMQADVEED